MFLRSNLRKYQEKVIYVRNVLLLKYNEQFCRERERERERETPLRLKHKGLDLRNPIG